MNTKTQPKVYAVIVAGGKGLRMGGDKKKQYLELNDIPILTRTLFRFDTCDFIEDMVLVVPGEDRIYCQEKIVDPYRFQKKIFITAGGEDRQASVFSGLMHIVDRKASDDAIVLIHDGVRPFVSGELIVSCTRQAIASGGCVPAIKLVDTVKETKSGNRVHKTVSRDNLIAAQTPQAFRLSVLTEAYAFAAETGFIGTDDASLVEHLGKSVSIVQGSKENIKITTPDDLKFAQYLCYLQQNTMDNTERSS